MCKAFPEVLFRPIGDSGDLKSRSADLPYRHQIHWQTRHVHESRQDSFRAVAGIRSVQPLRASGRCLSGQQRGDDFLGLGSSTFAASSNGNGGCGRLITYSTTAQNRKKNTEVRALGVQVSCIPRSRHTQMKAANSGSERKVQKMAAASEIFCPILRCKRFIEFAPVTSRWRDDFS